MYLHYLHIYTCICIDTYIYINVSFIEKVRIWGYFGPHFPAFGLNMERYGVSLRIQSECPHSVQMQENVDQNNPEYGHFSRSVCI